MLICEEEIEKCNEERRIQKAEFEQEVAKLEEARFEPWFKPPAKKFFERLFGRRSTELRAGGLDRLNSRARREHWEDSPDILQLLQKCGRDKPCPEKSICYENYCIPPHDDHAFVTRVKKRMDEALKQEKIEIEERRIEEEERRRAQINQIWGRVGDTVATRRGFNRIDSGIYRSPTSSGPIWNPSYSFNPSTTSSISSIDEETAANLETWLLCEEQLEECKKLKNAEKTEFDRILLNLKNY